MHRPSKDEYYINIAKVINTRSTCLRSHFGAVLVKDDQIIATGYNGSPRGDDNCSDLNVCERTKLGLKRGENYELCRAIHAEDNAITSAGRQGALGATMYLAGWSVTRNCKCSPQPCLMCARKIRNAGIKRVVGLFEDGTIADIDVSEQFYNKANSEEEK